MKKFHKNNKHNKGYDFDFLVNKNPNLKNFITEKFEKTTIDFYDSKAVKELNKSLLKAHYNINYWEFPDDNLCPPIPSRVDYLHYLSDIIKIDKKIKVLDIGTGASLIYPLLGTAEFGWNFVATDIDKQSLKSAKEIITKNKLSDKIELRFQKDKSHILEGIISENDSFTFTMCNPPFYKDIFEAKQSNERKNKNLDLKNKRNFAGKINELCYEGGEKAFVHNYLYESSKYPKASEWFTCLVSKKENVKSLQTSAKKLNVTQFKVIPMQQGNKITRVVCWSFFASL